MADARQIELGGVPEARELLGALADMLSFAGETAAKTKIATNQSETGKISIGAVPRPASVELGVRYQTLLEQVPAVVFMAALEDGRTEAYVSPHIEAVLGFTTEEWLDDPVRWYYQIYPGDRERWNVEAAHFLLSGQPLRSVYRVLARDGRVVWLHCEAKMVRRPDGSPWFLHGVGFDVSDLKRAEEELQRAHDELERRVRERTAELAKANADLKSEIAVRRRVERDLARRAEDLARSNRDLEQFAYSASHDLQEPIRNIAISAQLLLRNYAAGLDDQGRNLLNIVIGGAGHMENLVSDLLEYTRAARDSQTPSGLTDANEALNETLRHLAVTIAENKAEITSAPLPLLNLPSIRLKQIFQNLISNAIKYRGKDPPRIRVSARESEEGWTVSVKDNGIGISPEYHTKIFGLFKRLHTRQEYPGTGIGLAICRRIVENAGGKIWVESANGKGAEFRFTLPRSKEAASASS
jgi:PAS domain S-box-containing protein